MFMSSNSAHALANENELADAPRLPAWSLSWPCPPSAAPSSPLGTALQCAFFASSVGMGAGSIRDIEHAHVTR